MKRLIIIDRDGTIIVEPQPSEQVDSFEKFAFIPGAIGALRQLAALDGFELILATNQDGLGTDSFPEETFVGPHRLMIETLKGEGVAFADELIDRSFPHEGLPTRKPGTAMFTKYIGNPEYDLAGSYVIGDRQTDMMLAQNLGCKGLLLDVDKGGWQSITDAICREERTASVCRTTAETDIYLFIDLDGRSGSSIDTGLKFFDHMLSQISHHSGISLQIKAKGDLEVDEHHTMEDVAIVLGEAFYRALGSKRGIERYGFALPMDECSALVLLDLGGRIDFEWDVAFTREYVGDTPTEMFRHFFASFAAAAHCNLHISAKGENSHHLAEGIFKAFARSIRSAIYRMPFNYELPSSKGTL